MSRGTITLRSLGVFIALVLLIGAAAFFFYRWAGLAAFSGVVFALLFGYGVLWLALFDRQAAEEQAKPDFEARITAALEDRDETPDPSIEQRIKSVIFRGFAIDHEGIGPDSNLLTDLTLDSLEQVELMLDLEEAFSIQINDDEFSRVTTFGELVTYVTAAIGEQHGN
jgi:acyl carrier protein